MLEPDSAGAAGPLEGGVEYRELGAEDGIEESAFAGGLGAKDGESQGGGGILCEVLAE